MKNHQFKEIFEQESSEDEEITSESPSARALDKKGRVHFLQFPSAKGFDNPEDLEEELVIEDALRYDHDFENPLELDFLDDTPLHDLDFEEDFRSDVMLGRNSGND